MDSPSPYLFGNFDAAELALWVFWVFFALLIFYLRREDRREGYPLEDDTTGRLEPLGGLFFTARPKTFLLPHGHGTRTVPNYERDTRVLAARRSAATDGSPIEPTGDALVDGVGPGSWAARPDYADLALDGRPRIVPLSTAPDFHLAKEDPDPRGFTVIGCDGQPAGVVDDVWIDRSEYLLRYLQVGVGLTGRPALLPMTMAVVEGGQRRVRVHAVTAEQFLRVPQTKSPDQVTLLEEDKIVGYYGGGHLYATPDRQEPWL